MRSKKPRLAMNKKTKKQRAIEFLQKEYFNECSHLKNFILECAKKGELENIEVESLGVRSDGAFLEMKIEVEFSRGSMDYTIVGRDFDDFKGLSKTPEIMRPSDFMNVMNDNIAGLTIEQMKMANPPKKIK